MRVLQMRTRYASRALVAVGVGLAVHFSGSTLPLALRDPLGDALWASMVYWIISALQPRAPVIGRALAALACSYAVEFSQLHHAVWLDQLRATVLGQLVLGSGFDPRDLLAYAFGVAIAALIDGAEAARASGQATATRLPR